MRQKREKYVPKHRQSSAVTVAKAAPRQVLRTSVLFSGVAVAVTTGAVSTGVVSSPLQLGTAAQGLSFAPGHEIERGVALERSRDRAAPISRSSGREVVEQEREQKDREQKDPLAGLSPREMGRALLPEYGFSADQFGCLDALYVSESDWDVHADNPTSSAYGIPQALTEMHDLPPDYMTSAEAQIRWGLGYIADSYGSPCSAWSFKQANNWY